MRQRHTAAILEVDRPEFLLAAIIDSSEDAILSKDLDGVITSWNAAAERMFGFAAAEIIGKSIMTIVPAERVAEERTILGKLKKGERIEHYETLRQAKDGKLLDVTLTISPVRERSGRIVGASNIIRDISEWKRTDAALRASEARYRELFESIDEGFCIIKVLFDENEEARDYRFLECNPAFERHTGLQNVEGKTMREMIPHHDAHWFEIYGRIAHLREPERFESYSASLERWFGVFAFPVGKPAEHRVALIFNNITERKEAHDLLERTVEERTARLRETISELEAFSYSLSHDLRAPLRAIQGFAMVAMEDCGECANEPLQTVIRAAQRMDRLIQDVLSYSKVSRQELKLGPVDTELLLREIVRERPEFQPPRAELLIESPLLPVIGHDASLTQCFTNLLANAVKFVRPGQTPRVEISSESKGDYVRLNIKDNGIGISERSRRNLFGMFFRASHGYEGTGMGLAIVKRAVERMGGRLGVESAEGQGSCFWIELPSVASKMVAAVRDSAAPTDAKA